ncbi:MAG TPA: DMT family transporter [Negativicutes bacterium]|nr:DMT family transporter [Negativicutes bacterium]
MHTAKNNNFIFALLLFVVLLWGINVVMIKYLTNFFPPLALAPIRLVMATALLLPVVLYKQGYTRPSRSSMLAIIGVATFSIFLHQLALSWGIAMTSSTHASLILALNPLLTTVLASYLMKEPFTRGKVLGIFLGFSGVALVVSGVSRGSSSVIGDIVMFIATITFVVGSLFVKKSTTILSPLIVTAYSHTVASIGLLVTGYFVNPVWSYPGAFEPIPLAILLFSSLVNTALGALWWNMGIQRVGAATASLFLNGSPVTGVFAAAFFLGEELYWTHYAALVLVILGVSLGTGLIGSKHSAIH